ncbi:Uncharacterised protein [Mycobacteroides abscessus subsp. abscessus]|nr:Uncharacterised protein [Mycobacteroides abscessus subsp. abscessus]
MVTARIGPGQRTMAVPTLRQVRFLMVRLDSSSPNFVATRSTEGPMVSDAATTTNMPMAHGTPNEDHVRNTVIRQVEGLKTLLTLRS